MDMGCSLLSEVAIWFLLDIYLQVELMDHMVVLFWIFRILCLWKNSGRIYMEISRDIMEMYIYLNYF